MKLLKKIEDTLTIQELIEIAKESGLPMNTKISIMGAETKYVIEDNGRILLDEKNCLEEM